MEERIKEMDIYTNNLDQFKHMLRMQDDFNKATMKKKGIESLSNSQIYLALVDEIGELNHELKQLWCWWKDSEIPYERSRVLEELGDVWHFAMTRYLEAIKDYDITPYVMAAVTCYIPREINLACIKESFNDIIAYDQITCMRGIINLSESLGFTFEEIYLEYLRKNKITWERLKNGY